MVGHARRKVSTSEGEANMIPHASSHTALPRSLGPYASGHHSGEEHPARRGAETDLVFADWRGGGFDAAEPNPLFPGLTTAKLRPLLAPPWVTDQMEFDQALTANGQGGTYLYGPLLPGAANEQRMHAVNQSGSQACGTASLSMIMDYLGRPTSFQQIDREVRRTDHGATPGPLIDYARTHGLNAEGYQNGSWEEMKSFIARGIPVQALYNTQANGDPANGHFVAVVGFRTDPATGKEQILVRNSANGGKIEAQDRADFEHKWSNHFGYNKFFIAYAPAGVPLPPGRWDGIEALQAAATRLSNIDNNFDRIIHADDFGDFIHGAIGLPAALANAPDAAVAMGLQALGNWLDNDVGKVPVLGAFSRPIGKFTSGVNAAMGDFWGGVGNSIERMAGAVGSLFKGDVGGFFGGLWGAGGDIIGGTFSSIADLGKGAVNAVLDVGKTVVNGVGSVIESIGDFFGF
jgi:hypothetical protein